MYCKCSDAKHGLHLISKVQFVLRGHHSHVDFWCFRWGLFGEGWGMAEARYVSIRIICGGVHSKPTVREAAWYWKSLVSKSSN